MKEFSDVEDLEFPEQIRTMPDFLVDVALLTDADQEKDDPAGKVSLMTIHAAKGLEFPYVYIVGLEDGLFPSAMSLDAREDLEEERRLFYVALTRAEKQATISYALMRYKWGQPQWSERSPFIDEIDPIYLELPAEDKPAKKTGPVDFNAMRGEWGGRSNPTASRPIPSQTPPAASTPMAAPAGFKRVQPHSSTGNHPITNADVQEGNEVLHEKFGKGKVLKIEGDAPDLKATIFFPSAGQKQLLLKFAKLQVLS
jgi:DNA helicase-2/ATP-dependent DNA helicase PcrA